MKLLSKYAGKKLLRRSSRSPKKLGVVRRTNFSDEGQRALIAGIREPWSDEGVSLPRLKKTVGGYIFLSAVVFPILYFLFPVSQVSAQIWNGRNPVTCNQEGQVCQFCDALKIIANITDYLVFLAIPIAVLAICWGALALMLSGTRLIPGGPEGAKKIIHQALTGLLIALASWAIVNEVIQILTGKLNYPWSQIECVYYAPGIRLPPEPDPDPTGEPRCKFSGVNLCQGKSMSCTGSQCPSYASAIERYAGGDAHIIKAIMVNESGCKIGARSGVGACGLVQLLPSTANIYRSRCGVTDTITCAWLTNQANAEKSICIAAAYVRAIKSSACGSSPRNIAAGYNGGIGACQKSNSCSGMQGCSGLPMKKWECLYDNKAKTKCNTGYDETRGYAQKVSYCAEHPGF